MSFEHGENSKCTGLRVEAGLLNPVTAVKACVEGVGCARI